MKPRNAAAPNVKPVYVSLKNPAIVDFPPPHNTTPPDLAGVPLEHFAEEAQRLGYDGVIGHSDDVGREYVVFDPRQVKSATGNRGTYDPNDPSLLRAANLPGGLAGAWRGGATLLGAGTGATAGGVAGFATGDGDFEDRLKRGWQASLAGAALGGAAGLGLSRNTTGEAADNILRHAWDQAGKGQAEAVAARQTSGVIPKLGDIWPALKRARIQHPKNLLQDEGFGSVVTAGLQPRAWENLAQNREDVSRRLATAKTDEDLLPTPTQDRRAAMGLQGTPVNLGASLAQGEKKAGRQLSDIQTGIIEGGASLLSPTGLATNAIGVGLGAAKGLGRGALSGLFHGINDVTNGTFRSSIYDDELATLAEGAATDFLGALRAKGIDVSSLAPDGSFSAADAERVAGPAAGKAWAGWVNHANDLAQQRARFIMGDYGKVGPIEKMLGGPVPFASWVIRAYPVALALAAEHPIVALAMYQYYRATQKTKGDGSPDYTGGMIPIPTSTPYVGPLVSAMVPGNKGTVYVDPVGAISPVSNEMFSAGEDDPGATWYQKATKFLERTGLPGVNPAIQTGAYLTGLDYKGPGSQTNTQGLEDAAALIPGNAGLPNPMPGLLAAGRSAISPAIGPAIGGQADPNASVYDPVTKRYAELWYEKTHLTLSDPRNRIGLVGMADPDNPLMQQARREVLLAGAARNVNSLVDPVGATAQTDTAKDVKAAQDQAALPSYGALAGLDPFIRAQVQQQIDAAKAANPLLTLHQGETPAARANMLILDWERQNQGLRNLWPGMYQLQLLAERERLGLERPGSVAQEYRTFDQRNAGTLPGGPMIMPGVPLPMDNRAGQAVRDLVRQRLSAGR
jgi:sugar phosphate isomerase/epimerase